MAVRALAAPMGALLLLVALSLSVATGWPALWQGIGTCLLLGAIAGVLVSLIRHQRPSLLLLLALPFAVGLWRGGAAAEQGARPWTDLPREPVQLFVEVDAEAEPRGSTSFVYARVTAVQQPPGLTPGGRVRFVVAPLTSFPFGQRLYLEGHFEPVDDSTPWGQRLLRQGVVATASYPIVIPDPSGPSTGPFGALGSARAAMAQAAWLALPEPHASLLAGMVIGNVGGMSDGFRQALVASGTTHIVVVSGYNVSVVASALAHLRWAHWTARLLPLLGIWLFAILAGASPPAVRAALMASIGLLGLTAGRGRDALAALGLAVSVMLMIDPRLALDLGFQLSAFATLGLIALQPRIASLLPFLPGTLREPLAATFAAQLATLPVLVSTFQVVSVVSPLANLLIAPLVPAATIMGAILLPLVAAVPPLGGLAGVPLVIPTAAMVGVVEYSARAPYATWVVGDLPPPASGLYASALLLWAAGPTPEGRRLLGWLGTIRPARPIVAGLASIVALGAVAWGGVGGSDSLLRITVLDVGQGDAIFVRAPNGRTLLIDGGPDPALLWDRLGRRLGLMERNLSSIVLTRADAERLPGSVAAAERYTPALAVGPPEGSTLALYERWSNATREARQVSGAQAQSIELAPGVVLEAIPSLAVLGRGSGARTQRSLILRIVYGEAAVLVAPSLTPEAAAAAQASGWSLAANALVVAHHGDAAGLDQATLEHIRPSVAVIPVGARNRASLPSREIVLLLEGIPTYRTDLHGTVELHTDGRGLWVSTERTGT